MSPSFDALGVSADVVRALSARGITSPFDVQNLVLPDGLAGLDVLVASPTGSGKTLAFGIPMIERTARGGGQPSALVLVPTRELASQVVDEIRPLAKTRGLRIEAVYGGTSVMGQAKKARGAEILVATPGRLADLIDRQLISLRSIKVLVLDEADRMLDMGFRPQVDKLLSEVSTNRQTMLFSATLEGPVMELARRYTVERRQHSRQGAEGGGGGRDRARVPRRHDRRQAREPRRAARTRTRPCARLRPHQARRRQARQEAPSRPRRTVGGHAREHVAERPRAVARSGSSRVRSRR